MASWFDTLNTRLKTRLNTQLDERRFFRWYWCALCCFCVGIAQYFLLDKRLPTVLTEIQFSGSRATGNAVLAAWNFPNSGLRVVGATLLNIVLIPLYLPLLLMSVRGASRQYLDGAREWRGAFGAVCLLAVCAAVLENGCVIVWVLFQRNSGPDGLHAAFVFASAKALLYSATFLYVAAGWTESAWVRGAWDAVRVCGFSLFACIVGPLILLFGGQGAAIFGATASHLYPDDPKIASDPWPFRLALLATFVFSLMCWGAARYAVSYKIEDGMASAAKGEKKRRTTRRGAAANEMNVLARQAARGWAVARDWVPRFCGFAPGAILAYIAFSVAKAAREAKTESFGEQNIDVLAWGFVFVAFFASLWICLVYVWINGWWWLNDAEKKARERAGTKEKREKIFSVGYRCFSVTLAGLALVGCFSQSLLQEARFIGPLAAWFLSFAFIVPFFTWLVWLGRRGKKPLLALFLAYGYLVNATNLNDDHGLRHRYSPLVKEKWQQKEPSPSGSKTARTLNNAFDAWLASRPDAQRYKDNDKPYPVVFVAAAGGGIVAGSLVTATMAQIHKPESEGGVANLPDHLFAISSVSGGSLGAATYVTLRRSFPGGIVGAELAQREKTVFTTDMLSPSVASLLGPELFQRFLPVAVPVTPFCRPDPNYTNEYVMDRGRALDLAFEHALENGLPGATAKVRETIADYPTPAQSNLPALFLNTTCVQTGERMVVSTLRPDEQPAPSPKSAVTPLETKRETAPLPFETLYDVDPNVDLPLSTAACLSARFPVVSPPAFLPQWRAGHLSGTTPDKIVPLTVKRSYVDGGYCENTGVQTVMDVIAALEAQNAVRKGRPKWFPVIVSIHMNDQDVSKQTARKDDFPPVPRADAPRRGSGFDEVLGPAGAFFAGWGGPPRPELMRARLRYGANFIEMNFPKPALLSWYMSEAQYNEAVNRSHDLLRPASENAEPTAGDRLRAILAK